MKFFKSVLTFVLALAVFTACKNEKKPEIKTVETATIAANDVKKQLDPNATYAKTEFNIAGMTCALGCAKKVEGKLAKLEGVKSAKVDFDRKLAMVEYDVAKANPETLTTTVAKASDKFIVSNIKTVDNFSAKKCNCKEGCKGKCGAEGVKCKCQDCACKGCKTTKKACAKKDGKKGCCKSGKKSCAKKEVKKEKASGCQKSCCAKGRA